MVPSQERFLCSYLKLSPPPLPLSLLYRLLKCRVLNLVKAIILQLKKKKEILCVSFMSLVYRCMRVGIFFGFVLHCLSGV